MREKLEKRARLVQESRDILKKLDVEKRSFNTEEKSAFDKLDKEIDDLTALIEAEEKQELREKIINERSIGGKMETSSAPQAKQSDAEEMRKKAFDSYLRFGMREMPVEEKRTLTQSVANKGGFLVPDEKFVAELLKEIDDLFFLRNLATKFPLIGVQALSVPTLDTRMDDFEWTTEIGAAASDDTLRFGRRQLKPNPVAKLVKVSNTWLRNAAIPAENIVRTEIAYVMAKTMEKNFLTGNGVEKPLGIFTASNDGISTARDVSTDNTTSAVTFDGLIEAKYFLKGQYWNNASWMFNRTTMKMIRKIKNAVSGDYVWEPSVRVGEPDTILNSPAYMSEYVPNTYTTGLYVGIFGDFSKYWIADTMAMGIKRLDELYAETDEVGFIARMELDAMPAQESAFARVKLA